MSFNPVVIVAKGEKPEWYKTTGQFVQRDIRIALRQMVTTLFPYLTLLILMVQTVRHDYPYWITLTIRKLPCQADSLKVEFSAFFNRYSAGVRSFSASWGRCSL